MKNLILPKFLATALSATALLTAAPTTVQAQTLVHFKGSYLADATPEVGSKRGFTNLSDGSAVMNYSDTASAIPFKDYDTSKPSSTFYAVAQLYTPGTAAGSYALPVLNNGGENAIRARTKVGVNSTMQGMVFWKKSDFTFSGTGINSTDPLSLQSISELYVNVSSARITNASIRLAVQNDGVWYLSEMALVKTTALFDQPLGELALDDPASLLWAVWSPQTAAGTPMNPAPTEYNIAGTSLTNVTAFGYYFNSNHIYNTVSTIDVNEFRVTVIPEPGSVAMLGGGALILFGAARKLGWKAWK